MYLLSSDIIHFVKFNRNEVISEVKLIDIQDLRGNKAKVIVIGINDLSSVNSHDPTTIKSKLLFFNIQNSTLVKVLDYSDCQGIISMIQSINSTLLVSEGNKIVCYSCNPSGSKDLLIKLSSSVEIKNIPICSKISSSKTIILMGDIANSLSLVFLERDIKSPGTETLSLCGMDNCKYFSSACDFYIDGNSMQEHKKEGFILADYDSIVHVFLPNSDTNFQEVADIHLGKRITELIFSKLMKEYYYYISNDGSTGILKNISEVSHNQLIKINNYLNDNVPWKGGVCPDDFFKPEYKNKGALGRILDFSVLNMFFSIPYSTQKYISEEIFSFNLEIMIDSFLESIKI